jgi:hypothetical protein
MPTRLIAPLALAALAACGGGSEPGAVFEDTGSVTTSEAPAVSPAPSPADSTMMRGTVVDSAAAVRGTTNDSVPGADAARQ